MSYGLIQPVELAKINEAFGGPGGPKKLLYPVANFIESVMYWMNELVRIHKMSWCENDDVEESDIINEERFIWYRYNPNKEEFVPEDNGENLIGYPWNIQEFWFDFRKKIDFVLSRVCIYDGIENTNEKYPWYNHIGNNTALSQTLNWIYKKDINLIDVSEELFGQYAKLRKDEYLQFIPYAIDGTRNDFIGIARMYKYGIHSTGVFGPTISSSQKTIVNNIAYNAYINDDWHLITGGGLEEFDGVSEAKKMVKFNFVYSPFPNESVYTVKYLSIFSFCYKFLSHNKEIVFPLKNVMGCDGSHLLTANISEQMLYIENESLNNKLIYGYIDVPDGSVDYHIDPTTTFSKYLAEKIYEKILANDYTILQENISDTESLSIDVSSMIEEVPGVLPNPIDGKVIFVAFFLEDILSEQIVDPDLNNPNNYDNNLGKSKFMTRPSVTASNNYTDGKMFKISQDNYCWKSRSFNSLNELT